MKGIDLIAGCLLLTTGGIAAYGSAKLYDACPNVPFANVNVSSPGIGAVRETGTDQAITWFQGDNRLDGSVEYVRVILYGGINEQIDLGIHKNGHGYAHLVIPPNLRTGYYCVRVFGFYENNPTFIPDVHDQSCWFKIVDKGCIGTRNEHIPLPPIDYKKLFGYYPDRL